MKKDRQLVILLAALLVLIFFIQLCCGQKYVHDPAATDLPTPRTIPKAKKAAAEAAAKEQEP